jgi:hypothetical protein
MGKKKTPAPCDAGENHLSIDGESRGWKGETSWPDVFTLATGFSGSKGSRGANPQPD